MKQIAKERGGKCLSTEYINCFSKLLWECSEGHQWEAIPSGIKRGAWCPVCRYRNKKSIDDLNELAKEQGGRCLSEKYKGMKAKYKWQCAKEHVWETTAVIIRDGHWCPRCSRKAVGKKSRLTIELMHRMAKEKGGRCLSNKYKTCHIYLKWECSKGHKWDATGNQIRQGYWCPYCAGKARKTIEEMQEIAKEHGGECLSKNYTNANTSLKWKCKNGHIFSLKPGTVLAGRWCRKCWVKNINDAEALAEKRGFKCLSKDCHGFKSKLLWECKFGHQWETTYTSIYNGSNCPECRRLDKIVSVKKAAEKQGAFLITQGYLGLNGKLKVQCTHGHEWVTTLSNLKSSSCPTCNSIRKRKC